jgi:hypothetical protein
LTAEGEVEYLLTLEFISIVQLYRIDLTYKLKSEDRGVGDGQVTLEVGTVWESSGENLEGRDSGSSKFVETCNFRCLVEVDIMDWERSLVELGGTANTESDLLVLHDHGGESGVFRHVGNGGILVNEDRSLISSKSGGVNQCQEGDDVGLSVLEEEGNVKCIQFGVELRGAVDGSILDNVESGGCGVGDNQLVEEKLRVVDTSLCDVRESNENADD